MTRLRSSVLVALAGLAAACEARPEPPPVPIQTAPARVEPVRPDTTARAVWAWLGDERYAETWELWPETVELHPGAEPHGALLTTFVNPIARAALRRRALALPPGAAVVMENYLPDTTLVAVTVMVRSAGYDPGRHDWFRARYGSTGEIEAAGRVEACAECHAREPDQLFSGELGTLAPVDEVIGDSLPTAGG